MIDCPWCAEVVRRRAELLSVFSEVFPTFSDEVIMEAMVAEGVELPCLCYELAEMQRDAQVAQENRVCPRCTAEWANQLHRLHPLLDYEECEMAARVEPTPCSCQGKQ